MHYIHFTAEDNKLYENIKIREIRCKKLTGISLDCYYYYLSEADHEKLVKNQTFNHTVTLQKFSRKMLKKALRVF